MRAAGDHPRPSTPPSHPRASLSEFPIPQPGFRKETNPFYAPWRRFAPLWGSQVWGEIKGARREDTARERGREARDQTPLKREGGEPADPAWGV